MMPSWYSRERKRNWTSSNVRFQWFEHPLVDSFCNGLGQEGRHHVADALDSFFYGPRQDEIIGQTEEALQLRYCELPVKLGMDCSAKPVGLLASDDQCWSR